MVDLSPMSWMAWLYPAITRGVRLGEYARDERNHEQFDYLKREN